MKRHFALKMAKTGTKVRFRGDENKGKIVIEYYSKDELAGIYDRIMGN